MKNLNLMMEKNLKKKGKMRKKFENKVLVLEK